MYLDLVIESLIKAASTEVGKRGIDMISKGLRAVFDRGNREEIKQYITQQKLIEPAAKLAEETIKNSYVLPFSSLKEARPEHKVEFFYQIVKFGFELSAQLNMDILLPGSLVGPNILTLYSTRDGSPTLTRSKLKIDMGDYTSSGALCIIPTDGDASAIEICNKYKAHVSRLRQESEIYAIVGQLRGVDNRKYRIENISAGSVYYNISVCPMSC